MADIDILRQELTDDPLGRGYAGMADGEVADSLNVADRPGKGVVAASEVRRYVLLNGLWPRIQAVAASSANPVHQGTAITILQTLQPNSFDQIRMNDPAVAGAVTSMLTTMVEAGAITAAHRDAMVALGDIQVSRATELGFGPVHHLTVADARRAD